MTETAQASRGMLAGGKRGAAWEKERMGKMGKQTSDEEMLLKNGVLEGDQALPQEEVFQEGLSLEKFEEAAEAVKRVTLETKLVFSEKLSAQTGNKVYLKPENLQLTGAYKLREGLIIRSVPSRMRSGQRG